MSLFQPLQESELHEIRHGLAALTHREAEILELLVNADTSAAMARKLNISTRTVDLHRQSLLNKLRAKNAAELVKKIALAETSGVSTSFQGKTLVQQREQ